MPRDTMQLDAFAQAAGLSYVDDLEPGIRRRSTAKGFSYLGPTGRAIRDKATLDRIARLVIPPAWTDVWICPDPRGHIQATGRDQRGRKQYRYHADWRSVRYQDKYGRMVAFGRALPRLRKQVQADLAKHGLPREKVLAAVARLLEVTLIRVGNDEYARANKSFGLTTLRKRHVHANGSGAVFEFKGKSGKLHRTGFRDRRLARIVRACGELRGQRLFQFVDEAGSRHPVESADVNDYLRAATGGEFTAKDFRTWAGTLEAAQTLIEEPPCESEAQAKRTVAACVKAVAQRLGNTPAVCRACYIHPAVIEAYGKNELALKFGKTDRGRELALLRFLEALEA